MDNNIELSMNDIMNDADKCFIHTYNRNIIFEHGEGVYLYDTDGNKYLDMAAGIAVNALGYSSKDLKKAIHEQVDKLMHISNLYYNLPSINAAKYLCKKSGMDRVFFTNSGTEAIEGALKLARKYAYDKNPKSKGSIIAMEHSFHGRSMGALSVTGTEKYRTPFEPLIGNVSFAKYNDLDSVKALITNDTCAIILETLQGEGGIYPAEPGFIRGLRSLCNDYEIALILDEIQCGMGRTGKMFCFEHYQVKPDIMTTAKALGCGMPVGAFAANEKYAAAFSPGDHGTTYGGNPLATAAVCKVFEIFEEQNILKHVNDVSAYLMGKLKELKEKYPEYIREIRGKGLMIGIELNIPAADIINTALTDGLVLISAGSNIVRIVPPLIIENVHIDIMFKILDHILRNYEF